MAKNITKKILGKYEIIKNLGQDRFRVEYASREFEILQIDRNEDNERFSNTSSKLSNLSHRNLKTIQVEEDEGHFYFIQECLSGLEILDSEVFINGDEVDYKNLFECYLQLWEALHYIDKEGYYHGNINPSNILINTQDSEHYEAFLLDFGRSYYYKEFDAEQGGLRFYAPEQLGSIDSTPDIKSDIYAFGLCMLKLLLDSFEDCNELDSYKEPKDLEWILEKVLDEWELGEIENDIFLLVKKCCALEPEKRISLSDLKGEILNIYDKAVPKNTYELKCENTTTLGKYAENNDLDSSDLESIRKHIQMRIDEHTAFIRQVEEKNKTSKELESKLEIAINDLIFICSAVKNTDSYLWVWQVRENELTRIEKIINEGLELKHNFVFTTNTTKDRKATNRDTSSVIKLKNELDYRFQRNKLEVEQRKIDTKAIVSEERLLKAEKKDIDSKKKTHSARLDEIKKGANTLIFTFIKKAHKDDSDELESEALNEATMDKDNAESSNIDSKTKSNQDNFKQKEEVIIQEKCNMDSLKQEDSFKGEVVSYEAGTHKITIKLKETYDTLFSEGKEKELKKKEWAISYDYQVREILWSKRNTALEELKKGNTQIPNLLRKINEPKELRENAQVELDSYFNENLDENQQEAVRKALSLESDCEILLIQGPPGTGKTTTITEILKQYQKRHRHHKILITSQSNQAVDNVLEKICISKNNPNGEDKIFRIGNDKSKMSDIAKQYTPKKVLDKILKENKERIKRKLESKTATAEVSLQKNRGFQSGDEESLLDINDRADTAESTILTKETTQIESKLQALQKGFLEKLPTLSSQLANRADKNTQRGKRDLEIFTLFTKDIRLFFGTLLGISSWKDFRDVVFDVAIVDEAGRATLSELLVPCIKAKRMILVGDHKQLAPVVDNDVIAKLNVDSEKGRAFNANKKDVTTSLFERLFERIERDRDECEYLYNFRHTLTYNYRAHKSICDLYSKAFYKRALTTKPEISALKEHNIKAFRANAVWLDTGKRSDKIDKQQGTGKVNGCNAAIIYHTLKTLKEKEKILENEAITDIGIITPYKVQAENLKAKLQGILKEYKDSNINIDIGTVDSFQGSDRDIIIYDCVRSSAMKNTKQTQQKRQGSKIDFIADEKRLNVSLSRAKKLLLIVGDREYLRTASVGEGENPFSAIIEEFDDRQNME